MMTRKKLAFSIGVAPVQRPDKSKKSHVHVPLTKEIVECGVPHYDQSFKEAHPLHLPSILADVHK